LGVSEGAIVATVEVRNSVEDWVGEKKRRRNEQ
jgi:hypothetical protein